MTFDLFKEREIKETYITIQSLTQLETCRSKYYSSRSTISCLIQPLCNAYFAPYAYRFGEVSNGITITIVPEGMGLMH